MNHNFQSIDLDNFEETIDTRILERGFEYFKNDAILSIEQIDEGIWEAIISGSEEYEVTIHLQNKIIINSDCTCPYDLSDFCKHKVAVLNFLKYSDQAKNPHSNKMQRIQIILNNFSPEELKDNLLEIFKHHRNVRNEFLDDYGREKE